MVPIYRLILLVILGPLFSSPTQGQPILKEKTLVVWVSPANLDQKGGTALTLDDGLSRFDGIIFGEIADRKWMAGSNNFARTLKDQSSVAGEVIDSRGWVKIAIVFQGMSITLYRNDQLYCQYQVDHLVDFNGEKATVLFGQRHLEVGDPKQSFVGKIRDARIYPIPLTADQLRSLQPGEKGSAPEPWAWWDFKACGHQDVTHRFNTVRFIGDIFLEDGCLILKGQGASMIATNTGSGTSWDPSQAVPSAIVQNTRLFREKLMADPYRPAYHFCVPEDKGYPGDPNGAFYYQGRYHLMYLYEREGSGFCWGHLSSADLVHWRHHPDALYPGEGDEGAFSGGAFVDRDGTVYLSYWMLWGDKGIGLTRSVDRNFDRWEKFSTNPVIKSTEWGVTEMKDGSGKEIHVGSADPSNIWMKDDTYYMLTGNLLVLNKYGRQSNSPDEEQGDRLYLFSSNDLIHWEFQHRFYESNRLWTEASEDNMCPSFLPLPSSPDGGAPSGKHLLLFISHNKGCQYYIGDYRNDHFYPDLHGRMTWNDQYYFAPEALVDGQGRQIMWAWIFDGRPHDMQTVSGWTGMYGLPRSLWLGEDGTLRMAPVKELQSLRLNGQYKNELKVTAGVDLALNHMGHELMELEITIDPGDSQKFGVKVACSDDGREETLIYYDRNDQKLKMDTRKSGLVFGTKIIEEAPLELKVGEPLILRIFVDRSMVEVFANDRQAIARAVYPALGGHGIRLFSEGGDIRIAGITSWEMMPSNAY